MLRIAPLLVLAGCSAATTSSVEVGTRRQLSSTVGGGDSALVAVRVTGLDRDAEKATHIMVFSRDSGGLGGRGQSSYSGYMRDVRLVAGTYEIVVRLVGYRAARGNFTVGPREHLVLQVRFAADRVRLQELHGSP
jgi:hypothetical protein